MFRCSVLNLRTVAGNGTRAGAFDKKAQAWFSQGVSLDVKIHDDIIARAQIPM